LDAAPTRFPVPSRVISDGKSSPVECRNPVVLTANCRHIREAD
jgi:hypothetical protein